jgi:hypothetical protein
MATLKNSEVTPHKTLMSSDPGHTEADTSFWHLRFRCVKPGYSCHVTVFNVHFASVVGRHPVNRLHYFLSRFQDLLRNLTYIIEFLLISVRSLYEKANRLRPRDRAKRRLPRLTPLYVTADAVRLCIFPVWRDKGMQKGLVYKWEGMATTGRQNPETRFCRKLPGCLSVCVLAISNRCSKDSSCAPKGLVTGLTTPANAASSSYSPALPHPVITWNNQQVVSP